ncbi:MAG: sensor domain-containing diguanylate cyclase [bacterium]|nr:sensor domain-containing diguanylate cyclase [bacterium]MCM1375346.1 sensor domain-containing diguanylate cyclase [Muribaculum sp.]
MYTLRDIIRRYMLVISLVLVVIILALIGGIEISNEQKRARDNSIRAFHQIEQTLLHNGEELEEIGAEYRQTCLRNAQAIAYMIQNKPSALENIEELKQIAELLEVDEIHFFDPTGCIYAGTHPEYYGYTFDSGEQMNFFKPMLEDKSLKLVQDVTPNTAEAKLMQYSALWSNDGQFIVQVGMAPVRLMKVTEKNELSYIFSMLRIDLAADYYAIDMESGEIVGSTKQENVGKNLTEIGMNLEDVQSGDQGFHMKVDGVRSFCVFRQIGSNYIGRIMPNRILYQRLPIYLISLAVCLVLIVIILSYAVIWCMERYVVADIHRVNEKMSRIAGGNLSESIDIGSSVEFTELSSYINEMVKSLLANNRKMSYVLSKTNMFIGVYEYSKQMKKVRFTEYIPRIFALDAQEAEKLAADCEGFQAFLGEIRQNPVPEQDGVFQLREDCDRYVRLEEIRENNETFGVAIDVTEEVSKRRQIEVERDMDLLTGLYNRRGMEIQLSRLFAEPEKLGHYALVMVDADGLKKINDTYGHEKGDAYLKKIADTLNCVDPQNSIVAREGGDEFVMLLYHYEEVGELAEAIRVLEFIQRHSLSYLDANLRIRLEFSLGYVLAEGEADYRELLKQADERMYVNKKERRRQREQSE